MSLPPQCIAWKAGSIVHEDPFLATANSSWLGRTTRESPFTNALISHYSHLTHVPDYLV